MGLFDSLKAGLSRSREVLSEVFYLGGDVDETFWEELEDRLVMSDIGAQLSSDIVDELRETAAREALHSPLAIRRALKERLAREFVDDTHAVLEKTPKCALFVGINGAGKTTTVGKLAAEAKAKGKLVLIAAGDTFRAAAIEQLEVWASRAGVEIVERERMSDPASVCYDVLEKADELGADLVLIDTAGRLHTSQELMRELEKVVRVSRKRSTAPCACILVIDASCGQNGLVQAREFNEALGLDGFILTKLDGSTKGGIAVAIAHELQLPLLRVGVGERLDDLQPFVADDFCAALVGELS